METEEDAIVEGEEVVVSVAVIDVLELVEVRDKWGLWEKKWERGRV